MEYALCPALFSSFERSLSLSNWAVKAATPLPPVEEIGAAGAGAEAGS